MDGWIDRYNTVYNTYNTPHRIVRLSVIQYVCHLTHHQLVQSINLFICFNHLHRCMQIWISEELKSVSINSHFFMPNDSVINEKLFWSFNQMRWRKWKRVPSLFKVASVRDDKHSSSFHCASHFRRRQINRWLKQRTWRCDWHVCINVYTLLPLISHSARGWGPRAGKYTCVHVWDCM